MQQVEFSVVEPAIASTSAAPVDLTSAQLQKISGIKSEMILLQLYEEINRLLIMQKNNNERYNLYIDKRASWYTIRDPKYFDEDGKDASEIHFASVFGMENDETGNNISEQLKVLKFKLLQLQQIKQFMIFEQAARLMLMENQNTEMRAVITLCYTAAAQVFHSCDIIAPHLPVHVIPQFTSMLELKKEFPEMSINLETERAALVRENEKVFSFGNSVAAFFGNNTNAQDAVIADFLRQSNETVTGHARGR